MRAIYKYPLKLDGSIQTTKMPENAAIVHVHEQHGVPCMWAVVDPNARLVNHQFMVVATGQDIPSAGTYVGTVHIAWSVWHIYTFMEPQ